MGIIKTTIYECDGCGMQSDRSDFRAKSSDNGSTKVMITGNRGAGCGGSNISLENLFCFECSDKIMAAIAELKSK